MFRTFYSVQYVYGELPFSKSFITNLAQQGGASIQFVWVAQNDKVILPPLDIGVRSARSLQPSFWPFESPGLDISFSQSPNSMVNHSFLSLLPRTEGRRLMARWAAQWWEQLRIQHKVWTLLLLLCVPLMGGLATHLYIVQQLLSTQQQRHELVLAREHVELLRRLAIDIEDGFRGYVLTQQPAFLAPLTEAEARVDPALVSAARLLAGLSGFPDSLEPIARQLKDLLRSKHELIADIQRGDTAKALAYIRLGEGLRQSDRLRQDLRAIEDRLQQQRQSLNARAKALSHQTFVGLWIALAGVVFLGWISSRMLARSLTDPITRLQSATARLGEHVDPAEIGQLLATGPCLQGRTRSVGRGLSRPWLGALGLTSKNSKSSMRSDRTSIRSAQMGSMGSCAEFPNRAVELVRADVCLVLIRNERMGCWVVEAASGEWNDRLENSVMLWDELPISVASL